MKKIALLLITLIVIGVGFLSGCNEQTEQKSEDGLAPIINFFTATPSTVIYGNSITLEWSVENATIVSIDNGIGNVTFSGPLTIYPIQNQTYTITAFNLYGSSNTSVKVYVNLNEQIPDEGLAPIINFFTATPSTVIYGNSITLEWSVENATIVSIDNGIGNQPSNGSYTFVPSVSKKYILTASNENGTSYAYIILNVQKVD